MTAPLQPSLFEPPPLIDGLGYQPDLIDAAQEQALVDAIVALPLAPFDYRGFTGARRTTSFGWRYDFSRERAEPAGAIPAFLAPLRAGAAVFAGVATSELAQVLVTEYAPGAGIGWHRDRPEFGKVVGVSLASDCVIRFRRREGERWLRRALPVQARSAYLLDGPARWAWQHSIAPVDRLRYSITFRTLRAAGETP